MMLTYAYWQSHFGGDPSIVGKSLRINGQGVPVVGILQAAPDFPERMDAVMNMVNSEHHVSAMMVTGRTHRMTEMIARLAPGATVAEARARWPPSPSGCTATIRRPTTPGPPTRSPSPPSRKSSARTRGSPSGS